MHNNDTEEKIKGQPRVKGLLRLLLSMFIIWVFMFIIGPKLQMIPMVRPLIAFIEARDIDAGAYYYTDIEEFSEADIHMSNTMAYPTR